MKTSAQVKAYYQKQANSLFDYFNKPPKTFSENDFHAMRVVIKRMKALLDLLNKAEPRVHRKKYFDPFKAIFEQAAKIREPQVKLKLLAHYRNSSIEKLKRELSRQIASEKLKFSKMMKVSLLKELQKSTSRIERYLDEADRKSIAHYLDKKTKVVQKLGSDKNLKPNGVHELRKRIKEIYYLQKMLEKKGHRFARTDDFQELLGKWHDGRVLERGIKDFMATSSLPAKDIPVFEKLRQKITNYNQQLYQSILREKKAILKSFK